MILASLATPHSTSSPTEPLRMPRGARRRPNASAEQEAVLRSTYYYIMFNSFVHSQLTYYCMVILAFIALANSYKTSNKVESAAHIAPMLLVVILFLFYYLVATNNSCYYHD